jgi:hypothetical protein
MGISEKIVETVRAKFGLIAEVAEAAVWTRQQDDLSERITKADDAIAALQAELPDAVIRSIDAGATERRKLATLRSEREGLVSAAEAMRKKIDEVLTVERAAKLQADLAEAKRLGEVVIAAAQKADAAVKAAAEALAGPLEELKAAQTAFQDAVPMDYLHDRSYPSAIAHSSYEIAAAGFKARLLNDKEIVARPPIIMR